MQRMRAPCTRRVRFHKKLPPYLKEKEKESEKNAFSSHEDRWRTDVLGSCPDTCIINLYEIRHLFKIKKGLASCLEAGRTPTPKEVE